MSTLGLFDPELRSICRFDDTLVSVARFDPQLINAAGTTYTETGGAVSVLSASGADLATFTDMGQATSPWSASGADLLVATETGGALSAWSGSGVDLLTITETGGAISPWEATGADTLGWSDTGSAISAWSGSGADIWTPGGIVYTETGLGISPWTCAGEDIFTPYTPPSISYGGIVTLPLPRKKRQPPGAKKSVFYTPKKSARVAPVWGVMPKAPAQKAQMGLIQGQTPASILEWNVAQALDALGLRYDYQYSLAGGWEHLAGGIILDFLVYTPFRPTPVLVNGRYWHTGIHADELDTLRIKKLMHYRAQDVLVIWEENCQTVEQASMYLRQHLSIG